LSSGHALPTITDINHKQRGQEKMIDLLIKAFELVSRAIAAAALGALIFILAGFMLHLIYSTFVFSGTMLIVQALNGGLAVVMLSVLPLAVYAMASDVTIDY